MAYQKLAVHWTNLDEYQTELAIKAADLVDEANAILLASAQAAKAEVSAAYPVKTGNLVRGLVLTPARGAILAGAILRQRAPHGHLYEDGTHGKVRRLLGRGMYPAGTERGALPAHPTFRPITQAHRRAAMEAIVDRLYAHGASEVTGDVDAA